MNAPLNILLIDDDPDHRELLARALRNGRCLVRIENAGNCAEALAALSRDHFDLVLTDFNLDDGQADTLLRFIRQHRLACPSVVVSGSDEQDVVIRSMRSGSFDFLHKDEAVVPEKLWGCLDAVISRHRAQECERRKTERRVMHLELLATRDPLTGLANRRALENLFSGNGRRVLDRRGECVLMMVDIDHFKHVNDTYGHDCGDRVLRLVARTMKRLSHRSDLLARWGGEEILICRPNSTLAAGVRWAEQLRVAVARATVRWRQQHIGVTVSVGVHAEPCSGMMRPAVISADNALYYAKQHGRNRVRTSRHALFADLLKHTGRGRPEDNLHELLEAADEHLGPTQREHLTTHSQRVREHAAALAAALNLPHGIQSRLQLAGTLHDIGKFHIPDDVLAKPDALDDDEVHLLRRHAEDGAESAILLGTDRLTAEFIRRHHDRFDTSGKSTPDTAALGGQVIHTADALVTMMSDRPYHPARSRDAALEELRRQRGRQFAPCVVDAAMRSLSAGPPAAILAAT